MNNLIAPSRTLGYSNIFIDFVTDSKPATSLFTGLSPAQIADKLDHVEYNRPAICDILEKQNKLYGAAAATFDNIGRLRESNALCVFSGQQAGLFGGPMLIMIKALAIVKCARLYSEKLGRSVVPVFWIAGDDHDYEEVNHTFVFDRETEPIKCEYSIPPERELPTSEIKFDDRAELEKARAQLWQAVGESDFTPELAAMLERCYTPDDTYVTAFGKLMAALTSEYGLILFSPSDPEAKRLAIPFFKQIIGRQDAMHQRLNDANSRIQQDGYHIQVEKKDNAVDLFYNDSGRRPILRAGDNFVCGEQSFTAQELIRLIEERPERFSPDVMTRPVLQSYFFPVLSQKGGASEIAYLAQMNGIFDLFERVTPYYRARPSLTIIEKRFEKLIAEHNIEFEELVGDVEQLINRIFGESFPDNIAEVFDHLRKHIECHFEDITTASLKFDQALKGIASQTFGKIDFSLKAFEGKAFSAHKKHSSETREKIYRLWRSVYPNRGFQERSINVLYFLSRYGMGFIPFLYDRIDCEERAHQLIHLAEYK